MALLQHISHVAHGCRGFQVRNFLRLTVLTCLGLGIGSFATTLRADDDEVQPFDNQREVAAATEFGDEASSDDYDIAYQPGDRDYPRDARPDQDRRGRPGFGGPPRGRPEGGRGPGDARRGPPPEMSGRSGGPGRDGPGDFWRRGPRDGGSPDRFARGGSPEEVIRLLHELRDEVARLNHEIYQLRREHMSGPGLHWHGHYSSHHPGHHHVDFRGAPRGPGWHEYMRGDGRDGSAHGRGGPPADRRGPGARPDDGRGPDNTRDDRRGPDAGRGDRRGPDGPREDRRGPESGPGDRRGPDGPPPDRPRSDARPAHPSADDQPQISRDEFFQED